MTPKSDGRGVGPRAIMKNKKYREIAQSTMEKEREKIWSQQNDSPYEKYESTATSAQTHAMNQLVRPSCLDVSSENDLKTMAGKRNQEDVTWVS